LKLEVTDFEIINAEWIIPEQVLLIILKAKGAPIDGVLWLKLRPGFEWITYRNHENSSTIFEISEAA